MADYKLTQYLKLLAHLIIDDFSPDCYYTVCTAMHGYVRLCMDMHGYERGYVRPGTAMFGAPHIARLLA